MVPNTRNYANMLNCVSLFFGSMDQCGIFWIRTKIIRLPRDIKHRGIGVALEYMEFNQVAHLVFQMIEEIGKQQKMDNSR